MRMGLKAGSGGSPVRRGGAWACASLATVVSAAAVGVVALAGCNSATSATTGATSSATATSPTATSTATSTATGKAAYCGDRANLENSIKGLTSLNASSGVSGLKTQVNTVVDDATKLVNSAKGYFPSQTSAITSSVDALKTSVSGLSSNPSASQIATITTDAASVVTSVQSFMSASASKC